MVGVVIWFQPQWTKVRSGPSQPTASRPMRGPGLHGVEVGTLRAGTSKESASRTVGQSAPEVFSAS